MTHASPYFVTMERVPLVEFLEQLTGLSPSQLLPQEHVEFLKDSFVILPLNFSAPLVSERKQLVKHDDLVWQVIWTYLGTKNVLFSGFQPEKNTFQWLSPALEFVLSPAGRFIHEVILGSELFVVLLTRVQWFWKRGKHFVQVSGSPFFLKKKETKPLGLVYRRIMFYSDTLVAPLAFQSVSELFKSVFQIHGRHIRRRLKREFSPMILELFARLKETPGGIPKGTRPIPPAGVAKYLWDHVKRLVPQDFGAYNRRVLRKGVYLMVCGSKAVMDAKRIANAMRLAWNPSDTSKFVYFILRQVCISWIRERFYVSEVSHNFTKLVYFPKDAWRKRHEKPPARLCPERRPFVPLDEAKRLRLVPKDSLGFEVRPVACPSDFKDIRRRVAHTILKRILDFGPVCTWNLGLARQRIREFKEREKTYWVVKMDVRYAYDQVEQEKLWGFLLHALQGMQKESTHFFTINGTRTVLDPSAIRPGSIISDRGTSWQMTQTELLDVIRPYIFDHHVSLQGKTYLQRRGISQGSILSPLMCAYYYSQVLSDRSHPDSLFMRFMDDQVFLTKDRAAAERFFAEELRKPVEWNRKKVQLAEPGEVVWCGIQI
jgi:hypothetical protein